MVHDGSVDENGDAEISPQMGHDDGWVLSVANNDWWFMVVKNGGEKDDPSKLIMDHHHGPPSWTTILNHHQSLWLRTMERNGLQQNFTNTNGPFKKHHH